jgi:hypothetical protein
LIPGRYTLIGGIVIVLCASLAWWVRPLTVDVAASVHAQPASSDPRAAQAEPAAAPAAKRHMGAPSGAGPMAAAPADPPSDAWEQAPLRIGDRMRQRMEKDYERYYEDLAPALGLGEEANFALIRTLVEQRIQQYELAPVLDDRFATVEQARELREAQREDLRAMLGPQKLAMLDEYQVSIGAREEVLMLSRMAFANQPISEQQRRGFIREAIAAGAYFDEQDFPSVDSSEVVTQQTLAKMAQRDAKMLDVARRVLGEQYVAAIHSFQMTRRESIESTLRPVPE